MHNFMVSSNSSNSMIIMIKPKKANRVSTWTLSENDESWEIWGWQWYQLS